MSTDAELLQGYVRENSQAAFSELVQRHLRLVYATALRHVGGDAHLARDVAQIVFSDLARKAASLTQRPALAGWLFLGAHHAAAQVIRAERRRRTREQEAYAMQELDPETTTAEWDRVGPVLDGALRDLSEIDREAVLLRFFEQLPFGAIGAALHLREDAARMRVDRALEKLRLLLERRGVTSTSAALAAAFAQQPLVALPAGLAASVATGALASVGASGAAGAAILSFMSTPVLVSAAIALTGIGGVAYQVTRISDANAQVVELSRERDALRATLRDIQQPTGQTGEQLPQSSQEMAAPQRPLQAAQGTEAAKSTPASAVPNRAKAAAPDPKDLVALMRQAGVSDLVIYSAVRTAVKLKYQSERLALQGITKGRGPPRHQNSVTLTREQEAQLKAQEAREIAETTELVGPIEEVEATRAAGVKRRFGDLSPEKVAAVQKIENDYEEVAKNAEQGLEGALPRSQGIRGKLAADKEADIRRVLTAEEATDYFRFNSDATKMLMAQISNLWVDDETYARLADATLVDEAQTRALRANSQPWFDSRTRLYESYRAILGDGDFLRLARALEFATASVISFYQATAVPPNRQADLFFEARRVTFALNAASPPERQAIAAQAYTTFTTGVGLSPEQTVNFDRTRLGVLLKQAAAGKP